MRYLPVIAFLSITFFSASFLFSQEPVTICGSVIDKSNGLPLPYAQVSRVNSAMGTCSNEEGKFCLYIPAAGRNDSVLFSFLGYEMRKIAAKDLAGKDSAIEMTPRVLQLSEVVITSLTPEEVILRAVAAIPKNYGEDSTVLTAFVRNRKVINNRLAEYTEAILEDLKTGYTSLSNKARKSKLKDSNIASLVKGRVVADTNMVNALGDAGKSVGCLGCLFMNDFVEYPWNTVLDEDLFRYYHFRMEEISDTAGSKIYHIFYDQKKGVDQTLWKGEIYVEASSYAVMKFAQKPSMEAFSAYEKKKYRKTYVLKEKPGWIAEMPHVSLTVTYAERNGKWTLNTVQNDNWILFMDPATGEKITVNAKSEVVVTDVSGDSERLSRFKGVSKSTDLKRWDQYVSEPDNAFWATYNYLPVEAKLKASLERLGSD